MIMCYILCGIAICVSIWAAWRAKKNTKAIIELIEVAKHLEPLYESIDHIYGYLLNEQTNEGELKNEDN